MYILFVTEIRMSNDRKPKVGEGLFIFIVLALFDLLWIWEEITRNSSRILEIDPKDKFACEIKG